MAVWLFGAPALAAEPCAPEVTARSVRLSHQGREGVWFDARVAQCLLEELQSGRERLKLLDLYERRDTERDALEGLLERQLALSVQETEHATAAMQAAIRQKNEAERELRAPGRSRALWFAVGFVSGMVVVGLSAYALSTVQ